MNIDQIIISEKEFFESEVLYRLDHIDAEIKSAIKNNQRTLYFYLSNDDIGGWWIFSYPKSETAKLICKTLTSMGLKPKTYHWSFYQNMYAGISASLKKYYKNKAFL